MSKFSHYTFVLIASALAAPAADDFAAGPPVTLDQVEITAAKEKHYSLALEASPATGSRLGLIHRDLPASVAIITQEMMQLRGFRTAVEAVEGAVGMTGGTQYGSIPGYATRGFTSNSVTILRDGIRQNTGSQSSRTIDSFLLDRVEVLKGPASLLFGEGAIGGAVNYLSKSPDHSPRGELLSSYGAWNTARLGLGVGGPVIKNKLFFRADYSHSETDGYVDRNAQRYDAFGGSLEWAATSRLNLTFSTTWLQDWNQSYYGNPVIYDAVDRYDPTTGTFTRLVTKAATATDRLVNPRVDPAARRTNYDILDNYAKSENAFQRVRAEWSLTPAWKIRNESYLATQLLKWRNLESNLWNPVTQLVDRSSFVHIYRDDLLIGNRLDATYKGDLFGRAHRLVIGGLFERNDLIRGSAPTSYATTLSSVTLLNPDVGHGPGDPDRFQKTSRVVIGTAALYLEDVLDLTPSLKLVTGLRYDDIGVQRDTLANGPIAFSTFEKSYHPFTGRAGLVWTWRKDLNLYASYSRAAEPVTQLVSLTTVQNDFSLQKGRQYEVGAKGSLLAGRVDFTFALYAIEKKNLLTSTLDPVTGQRLSQQIGAQVSQGAEWAVAWSPAADWHLQANVAWNWKAEYEDYNENLGSGVVSRSGNTPANVPEVVTGAYLSKDFGPHWRLGSGPRYVGRRASGSSNLNWSPDYTTLEASLTYQRARWSATLRGRNLLNADYEEWATGFMQRLADPRSAELNFKITF